MYIMNAESKRRSDSGIFGVRITEFGVVVRRYHDLKFGGLFCGFSGTRDHSRIIFQKQRSAYKILDCGLITQKFKDIFARSPN
jgi:hypothetical protein